MPDFPADEDAHAILGSVSGETVTFVIASRGDGIIGNTLRTYSSQNVPTFSDAMQSFAKETALTLNGTLLVLSVAGAVRGDVARITNGRWYISIPGLQAMLRRRPIVLNDVSAVVWSTLMLQSRDRRAVDSVTSTDRSGHARIAVVWVGEGLGAGCLAYGDNGLPFVLDGEGGHMTCPIEDAEQQQWLEPARLRHGHLSYERAFASLREIVTDRSTSVIDQNRIQVMNAALLGGFAGSIALTYGAWGGIYLAGPGVEPMLRVGTGSVLRERFVAKGRFKSTLSTVPIWTLARADLPLLGTLALLSERHGPSTADQHNLDR